MIIGELPNTVLYAPITQTLTYTFSTCYEDVRKSWLKMIVCLLHQFIFPKENIDFLIGLKFLYSPTFSSLLPRLWRKCSVGLSKECYCSIHLFLVFWIYLLIWYIYIFLFYIVFFFWKLYLYVFSILFSNCLFYC